MTIENRTIIALQNSTTWIAGQRWFGDKARPVTSTNPEIVQIVDIDGRHAALAIVRFSFEWRPDASYFIPILETSSEASESELEDGFQDATRDPAFLRWFVEGFSSSRIVNGEGAWTWRSLGEGLPEVEHVDFDRAKAISGEQSNTSIVFDRRFIGKIFRRVQPGLNPDLEIGEFLSADNRYQHAPRLYGLVEVEHEGRVTAVAAMQEFVPNNGDGWTWLLNELRSMSADTLPSVVESIRQLARRTGELHVALASDSENPAFAPEPFTAVDAQDLIGRVISEIEESVEGLVRHLPPSEVEQIHKGMGNLMGDAHMLVGTSKIRVHGDYHLGQILRTTDDDFMLIDFEGEPSRTMDQRRMKLPGLKDVAGMVRSLDYAAATVLQEESYPTRHELIESWLQEATQAYVDAYRETVAGDAAIIVPAEKSVFTAALDLMIGEKALYEVRYELNNRPDWLPIPLNALRRLFGMDVPAPAE